MINKIDFLLYKYISQTHKTYIFLKMRILSIIKYINREINVFQILIKSVPWNTSRDSLSFGQFDLLKSKILLRVDGGLSSDQSEMYLGHGLVSKFQHKLHDDEREKCLRH